MKRMVVIPFSLDIGYGRYGNSVAWSCPTLWVSTKWKDSSPASCTVWQVGVGGAGAGVCIATCHLARVWWLKHRTTTTTRLHTTTHRHLILYICWSWCWKWNVGEFIYLCTKLFCSVMCSNHSIFFYRNAPVSWQKICMCFVKSLVVLKHIAVCLSLCKWVIPEILIYKMIKFHNGCHDGYWSQHRKFYGASRQRGRESD